MKNLLRLISLLLLISMLVPVAVADDEEMEYEPDFTLYEVGDTFFMGVCEQDNNRNNGFEPIEWLVLDKFEDRLFVISLYCLESDSYYNPPGVKYKYTTYEECDVRAFLNTEFYTCAFTDLERSMIALTHNRNDDNPDYGIEGGNDTEDYVFLISHDECMYYFPTKDSRRASPTRYCTASGADVSGKWCFWWLRTPGKFRCNAEYVFHSGRIYTYGSDVGHAQVAFRPAMVIYTNSQARDNADQTTVWQNPHFAD